jgi:hypothetical protein
MDSETAKQTLGVSEPLCADDIRRKYRRAALRHHPDKGGSAEQFRRACEAHDLLQKELGEPHRAELDYSRLLQDFIGTAFPRPRGGGGILQSLASLVSGCKAAATSLASLRDMDPRTCLRILGFLERHADLLHIDPETIAAAREALRARGEVVPTYTLTATLDHILDGSVYKLQHQGQEFLVPLWHEDLVFDTSAGAITVQCRASLPEHVFLDERNDVHVNVKTTAGAVLETGSLTVALGGGAVRVPAAGLRLCRHQAHRLRGRGGPRIDVDDVYQAEDRGDVVVHVELTG